MECLAFFAHLVRIVKYSFFGPCRTGDSKAPEQLQAGQLLLAENPDLTPISCGLQFSPHKIRHKPVWQGLHYLTSVVEGESRLAFPALLAFSGVTLKDIEPWKCSSVEIGRKLRGFIINGLQVLMAFLRLV